MSTRLVQPTVLDSPNNGPGPCAVASRWLSDVGGKLDDVLLNGIKSITALNFRPHGDL